MLTKFQLIRTTNKKVLFLKKISVLLFETVKNLIFWIVTRVSTRDYTVYVILNLTCTQDTNENISSKLTWSKIGWLLSVGCSCFLEFWIRSRGKGLFLTTWWKCHGVFLLLKRKIEIYSVWWCGFFFKMKNPKSKIQNPKFWQFDKLSPVWKTACIDEK